LLPLTSAGFIAEPNVDAGFFRKIPISLGSLHLTLMAAIGIWFWNSPGLFMARQSEHPPLAILDCTSMSLMGTTTSLSSSPLRAVSLVIYAFFLVPGLNLLVPAALFLALYLGYHHFTRREDNKPSVKPVAIGLLFLLAVNIVFMVDIESTISHHEVTDESKWTFGQTLAVLLLVLPIRDVVMFIMHVRKEKRNEERRTRCTQDLKDALKANDMAGVKKAVQHADIQAEVPGTSPDLLATCRG
jgi:hypothetical protein